ncbi:MAG TPA: hypothetical protein VN381_13230 [Anaerovoracaceae bacterium]|nr:hypothetical protein [Anaerovoracaceae bacterium]
MYDEYDSDEESEKDYEKDENMKSDQTTAIYRRKEKTKEKK